MSLADRANIVQSCKGCTLCTDWSGKHDKNSCDAKNSKGDPLKSYQDKVNGAVCGIKHHPLLHGSSVQYCNLVHGNRWGAV